MSETPGMPGPGTVLVRETAYRQAIAHSGLACYVEIIGDP